MQLDTSGLPCEFNFVVQKCNTSVSDAPVSTAPPHTPHPPRLPRPVLDPVAWRGRRGRNPRQAARDTARVRQLQLVRASLHMNEPAPRICRRGRFGRGPWDRRAARPRQQAGPPLTANFNARRVPSCSFPASSTLTGVCAAQRVLSALQSVVPKWPLRKHAQRVGA